MGGTHKIFADIDVDGEVKGTSLDLNGNAQIDGTITVGVDDTGYDVKFFGATSGRYMLWDASDDSLLLLDNTVLKIGTGLDLKLKHDGTDSLIFNETGHLYIQNKADDKDIEFQCDDGSGGTTAYIRLDGSAGYTQAYKNIRYRDNVKADFGDGGDLDIYHDGSNSYISQGTTGDLYIRQTRDDGDIYFQSDDGSGGNATYIHLDGSDTAIKIGKELQINGDSRKLKIGASGDLEIFHNGTDSTINNATGDLYIKNEADDKDIIFSSDNGSGGVTAYLTLDGSSGYTKAHKHILYEDDAKAMFGTGGDMQIVHDGSNSYISQNVTGELYIENNATDGDVIFRSDDGAGGIATYFFLDGSTAVHDGSATTHMFTTWVDNSRIAVGTGRDFQITHNGTDTYCSNNTGDLIIQNNTDDKDIVLKSDDGSGGTTTYLTLDGSTKIIELAQITNITTDTAFRFGHSSTFIEGATSGSKLMLNGQTDLFMRINGSTVGQFDANNFVCTPKITADAGIDIDNFNIDGTTIALSSGDMTLDPAGDMIISMEDGSNIDFKNGGNVASRFYAESGTASTLFIYENGGDSSTDYCSINVATHGATTISTVDGAAAAAHFTLDVDGNIELNADGGTITFADAGSSLGTITSSGYSGTSAVATSATITANNTANETVYPVFVDGATGTQGLESDTGLTYNPSTGVLTSGKLTTDVAEIVENNKSNSALMTLTGQGAGNEANIGLKLMGTSNGNPIKLKMKALDSSGGEVGAGLLSYDADDDSFAIGQNSNHNRMAIHIENTITSPSDGGTYVYYEPTGIKAREYVASSNSTHYDFQGDIIRNGNDTTVRGKMYCYKNGTWTITNADTKLDANGLLGIALGTNSTTHGMLLKGTFTLDYDPGGAGNPLYLHTTDGLMSSSAPTSSGYIVRIVGYLLGGTHGNIFFDPDKTYVEIT